MAFATVLTNLLLVSAALAASSSEARLKHRRAAGLQSKTTQHLGAPINKRDGIHGTNDWLAGAIHHDVQNTYTAVSAVFTVPHLTDNGSSSAAAYVMIDGYTCQTTSLQAGVRFGVSGSPGVATYRGFYGWGGEVQYFDDNEITFKEGDRVNLTVNAPSTNTGFAIINNESIHKVAQHNFTSHYSSYLCRMDAAWVVQGFANDISHFGEIVFSGASATTPKGDISPVGADIFDIQRNDQNYTSVSVNSSSVTVQRL